MFEEELYISPAYQGGEEELEETEEESEKPKEDEDSEEEKEDLGEIE